MSPTVTWNSLGVDELSTVIILDACSKDTPSTVIPSSSASSMVTKPSLPDMAQQAPRLLSSEMMDFTGPILPD